MPVVRMTDAACQRLKAPPGKRIDYFDSAMPGLHLRVTGATGQRADRRTWSLLYTVGGKVRRVTFGLYPALSLAKARQETAAAQEQMRAGIDPATAQAAAKAEAARPPDTVANVVQQFIHLDLERRNRAPEYIANTRRLFQNHVLPRWAKRDVKTISKRDVIELLDQIVDEGKPVTANRTFAALRAMFRWATRRGIIDAPPTVFIEAPGEENSRERVLSDSEIAAIWTAASSIPYPFGPFFQLCVLTGQRRSEVSRMRWDQIDNQTWALSADATKTGRAHLVPLSPLALDIISGLLHTSDQWCFSTNGTSPISGFSKAKIAIDESIADGGHTIAPWTIHDLRRTCATNLGRLGVSRFIIGRVLNHSDRSITGVYDRHMYMREKRAALEVWAEHLNSLVNPPPDNLVPLHAVTP
jgi:integrase